MVTDGEPDASPSRAVVPSGGPGPARVALGRVGELAPVTTTDVRGLLPAAIALALILVWSVHDGGFDADTWYWGALVLLGVLAATVSGAFGPPARLSRPVKLALGGFGLYVLWSYASMLWAGSPGTALTGSNRALLYLVLFTLFVRVRWTPRRALWSLAIWTVGVGIVGVLVLAAMAQGRNIAGLFSEGRLVSPTGYFNSDAAMFMMLALVGTGLSVRRELPVIIRGLVLAFGCAGLELVLLAESRGWLFTLPVVLVLALLVLRDRLATSIASLVPIVALLAILHPLLQVYDASVSAAAGPHAVARAAEHAGRLSLLAIAAAFLVGVAAALLGPRLFTRRPGPRPRLVIGLVAALLGLTLALVGVNQATHSHPIRFMDHQWHAFTHPGASTTPNGSHFAAVGSERYDAWRVAIKAFLAHPIGGLGQDNFSEYFDIHRTTPGEYEWTHSLEMRLLAHTGAVGTMAFLVFLAGAVWAAIRKRRDPDPFAQAMTGIALLPLIVWLIPGSIDWFWEMPALSGPALGFLAMAGSMTGGRQPPTPAMAARRSVYAHRCALAAGLLGLIAAVVVLGFPYLSQRELSIGSDLRSTNPAAALRAFDRSGSLDPLNADAGRFGGTFALEQGLYPQAITRFEQSISRDRQGWFSWLGLGLAQSALGDRAAAHRAFVMANSINYRQPAVPAALNRVYSAHPLTVREAIGLLVVQH